MGSETVQVIHGTVAHTCKVTNKALYLPSNEPHTGILKEGNLDDKFAPKPFPYEPEPQDRSRLYLFRLTIISPSCAVTAILRPTPPGHVLNLEYILVGPRLSRRDIFPEKNRPSPTWSDGELRWILWRVEGKDRIGILSRAAPANQFTSSGEGGLKVQSRQAPDDLSAPDHSLYSPHQSSPCSTGPGGASSQLG
jgi:hypothetical protein